jgi:hypothetical protein
MVRLAEFPITRKWPPEHPQRIQLYSLPTPNGKIPAIFPWVNALISFYEAGDLVGIADFAHVRRTLGAFLARPAVVRGMTIPRRP